MIAIERVRWQRRSKRFRYPVWIGRERQEKLPSLWMILKINGSEYCSEICPLPNFTSTNWEEINDLIPTINTLVGTTLAGENINFQHDLFHLLPGVHLPPIFNFALENILLQVFPGTGEEFHQTRPLPVCHLYDEESKIGNCRLPVGKIKIRPPFSAEMLVLPGNQFHKLRLDGNCSFNLKNFPYFLLENSSGSGHIEFFEEPFSTFDQLIDFQRQFIDNETLNLALDEHLPFYLQEFLPHNPPLRSVRYYVYRPSQWGLAVGRRLIQAANSQQIKVVISSSYDHAINFCGLEYLARFQNFYQTIAPGLDTNKYLLDQETEECSHLLL